MTRVFPAAVETEADLPKFCGDCGREMVRADEPGMFDRFTGERGRSTPLVRCPRWNGQSWRHEAFVVSRRPELPPADPDLLRIL